MAAESGGTKKGAVTGAGGIHPAWADELRRRYLRGEASQFILHGNVFDVVEWGGELLPLGEYLTEHLLGENKDLIVVFNLATGGRLVAAARTISAGLEDLLVQRQPTKFLPAMERLLKTEQKVALIIEYAETVAPAADPALMQDDDRTAVVTLHRWSMSPEIEAADNVVLLLAENLSELHPKLVSNPKIATVRLPMPDEETRRRVVAVCQPEADAAWRDRLAGITAGLRAVQMQAILQPRAGGPGRGAEEQRVRFLKELLAPPGTAGAADLEARARKLAALTRGMSPEEVRGADRARRGRGGSRAGSAEAAGGGARRDRSRSSPTASGRSSSASVTA